MNVLTNKGTPSQREVVIANSGLAISTVMKISIEDGIEKAKESLKSESALQAFNTLKKLSKQ